MRCGDVQQPSLLGMSTSQVGEVFRGLVPSPDGVGLRVQFDEDECTELLRRHNGEVGHALAEALKAAINANGGTPVVFGYVFSFAAAARGCVGYGGYFCTYHDASFVPQPGFMLSPLGHDPGSVVPRWS